MTTIYLIGDSTVANFDKSNTTKTGWGEKLAPFFSDQIIIHNAAKSGESSKSFLEQGYFATVADQLKAGDYLFIQFGHNDQKDDSNRHTEPNNEFKTYLANYIRTALEKAAYPVLITPVSRRNFNDENKIINTHKDYANAVRELADHLKLPCLDLTFESARLYQNLGRAVSKTLFTVKKNSEGKHVLDKTHFSHDGAQAIAKLVIACLKKSDLPLTNDLVVDLEQPELEAFNCHQPVIPDHSVILTAYGGRGDGQFDNTEAITDAIQDCHQKGGGKIIIERGIWLSGPIKLKSKINLHLNRGAVLLFNHDKHAYPIINSSFEGIVMPRCQAPIDAEAVEDVAITGEGIIDGAGSGWRPIKKWKLPSYEWTNLIQSGGVVDATTEVWWPSEQALKGQKLLENSDLGSLLKQVDLEQVKDYLRPCLISIRDSNRILIEGVTIQNSPAWAIHPWLCQHVTIAQVSVRNPWYAQNGDGLDIESCRFVMVKGCLFDVGDDAICIKSGKRDQSPNIPSESIIIEDCQVFRGHGGFVLGSEMSGSIRHVEVRRCQFIETDRGIRIKTMRGRGGSIEQIQIKDIQMVNIKHEAISIRMDYAHEKEQIATRCLSTLPLIRELELSNINISGADKTLQITGLPEEPIMNIKLTQINSQANQPITIDYAKFIYFDHIKQKVLAADSQLSIRESSHLELAHFKPINADYLAINVDDAEGSRIKVIASATPKLNMA
ncbi:DNA sulfur modification protein DndE [Amphibacillus marinus]|uniref:DNA sulfur modification protein DndE n=1 Tax=Amphibacillus marinus TaxID=872970 RepID=A0A1H8HAJ2_9BACI|nr:glycosyl hydrolase family 28 protein [Amphibacillus marinus]SEN53064.1 DNA sulfur modification protein DndE [Amphibacillus marinus]